MVEMVGGGNLCFVKIEFGEIDGFYMADCVNLYRKYLRKITSNFKLFVDDKRSPEYHLFASVN